MSIRKQKHMDESWVVKANRERDRLADIKSREQWDGFREEFRRRIREDQVRDPGWFPVPHIYDITCEIGCPVHLEWIDPVPVVKDSQNVLDTHPFTV